MGEIPTFHLIKIYPQRHQKVLWIGLAEISLENTCFPWKNHSFSKKSDFPWEKQDLLDRFWQCLLPKAAAAWRQAERKAKVTSEVKGTAVSSTKSWSPGVLH